MIHKIIIEYQIANMCVHNPLASPGPGKIKKGPRTRAQEGINSKGNIIDIEYPIQYIYI